MKAPIKSKKHINQIALSTVGQGLVGTEVLLDSVEGTSTTPAQVEEGAIVKACYVELWLGTESATVVNSYTVILYKAPSAIAGATTAEMAALHDYKNKKNILFTGQGLLPIEDGGVIPVLKQWYPIPKGKQRFGLGDRLLLTIRNNSAAAIDYVFCGVAIYKEYT